MCVWALNEYTFALEHIQAKEGSKWGNDIHGEGNSSKTSPGLSKLRGAKGRTGSRSVRRLETSQIADECKAVGVSLADLSR